MNKQNDTFFQISYAGDTYTVEGVQVTEMETKNDFWHSNDIYGQKRSQSHSTKGMFSLVLRGIFVASKEQLLLQKLILKKKQFKMLLRHPKFKIFGTFDVHKYAITHEDDAVEYFALHLSCSSELKYNLIR